ncbi:DoxX family protein [Aestuariibaculum suncheonense]|nr:DoxX family protein [Aestuariibaculum suncheonense]
MLVKICLRLAISTAFLSAVADRFGLWPSEVSVWGNWNNFINYTQIINPWFPESVINSVGVIATAAELLFAMCLIIGFKTEWVAKLSGLLLLVFGLSMTFSTGIKGALDFSVFTASAAAFALSLIKEKHWKLDNLLEK